MIKLMVHTETTWWDLLLSHNRVMLMRSKHVDQKVDQIHMDLLINWRW